MNDTNGQIGLVMKRTFKEGYPFYLQNLFSKKKWNSTFSQTEELYT